MWRHAKCKLELFYQLFMCPLFCHILSVLCLNTCLKPVWNYRYVFQSAFQVLKLFSFLLRVTWVKSNAEALLATVVIHEGHFLRGKFLRVLVLFLIYILHLCCGRNVQLFSNIYTIQSPPEKDIKCIGFRNSGFPKETPELKFRLFVFSSSHSLQVLNTHARRFDSDEHMAWGNGGRKKVNAVEDQHK